MRITINFCDNCYHKLEQCWVITGFRWWRLWFGRLRYLGEGEPAEVSFDYDRVIELEERGYQVIGFRHTHPNMLSAASGQDIQTMDSWRTCLGRDLLCIIDGLDGRRTMVYSRGPADDQSSALWIAMELIKIGPLLIILW